MYQSIQILASLPWEDALEQITEQYGDSSETDLRCEILTLIFLNSIISKSTTQA